MPQSLSWAKCLLAHSSSRYELTPPIGFLDFDFSRSDRRRFSSFSGPAPLLLIRGTPPPKAVVHTSAQRRSDFSRQVPIASLTLPTPVLGLLGNRPVRLGSQPNPSQFCISPSSVGPIHLAMSKFLAKFGEMPLFCPLIGLALPIGCSTLQAWC